MEINRIKKLKKRYLPILGNIGKIMRLRKKSKIDTIK
jgi:hypothetical protein